jgi:hypothetical protein
MTQPQERFLQAAAKQQTRFHDWPKKWRTASQSIRVLIAALIFVPCALLASSRQKTDIVYMRNGDRITCEIRSLEQGQLTVKPDYTDSTIILDWAKVDHIESRQQFIVLDPHGAQYYGIIGPGPESRQLAIFIPAVAANPETSKTLPYNSVIQIEPLGGTFLKRLRGNIDVGLSFQQSNAQKNLTVQSGIVYQSEQYLFSLDTNSQFTSQQETRDTNESTLKTALYKEINFSNWYGGGLANFLSSSEQQINLQSTLGGGVARRAIFTNRTNLALIGGLAYTIERDAADTISTTRTHAVDSAFAVQYSTFRFDSTTFDTTYWIYPSLSAPGHVRFTLNQDVYYKFLGDFYVRVSFYDNYDNRPVVGAPENNLGASSSIGWSFH